MEKLYFLHLAAWIAAVMCAGPGQHGLGSSQMGGLGKL